MQHAWHNILGDLRSLNLSVPDPIRKHNHITIGKCPYQRRDLTQRDVVQAPLLTFVNSQTFVHFFPLTFVNFPSFALHPTHLCEMPRISTLPELTGE